MQLLRVAFPAVLAILSAALAPTAGCSRSDITLDEAGSAPDGAAPSPVNPPEVDAICERFAVAFCDKLALCDYQSFHYGQTNASFSFRDAAQCQQRLSLACTTVRSIPGASADPAPILACATKLETAACRELPPLYPRPDLEICDWGGGSLANGSACRLDLQCQSARCVVEKSCGVCRPSSADGASCGGAGVSCRAGSSCVGGVCAADSGAETPCGKGLPACREGLDCNEVCRSSYDRPLPCGGLCDAKAGQRCDGASGSCAPIPTSDRGSCGNRQGAADPNPTVCVPEQGCLNQNDFGSGSCQPLGTEGAACKDYEGPGCLFPAVCVSGICALRRGCP